MSQDEIRILVAEDDYLVMRAIVRTLHKIGYLVAGHAVDGRQAVEMTESLRPDVVLMDIRMPDMDGIEATHLINERCPTPVVIMTAHESPEQVKAAGEAGAGAYLVKPSRASEMERAIVIAMARFNDMMTLRRLNAQLEEALAQVKRLGGLLPMCANCKKIRDDDGYWHEVATYIKDHSEAVISHGLCQDCLKELYPPDKHPYLYDHEESHK